MCSPSFVTDADGENRWIPSEAELQQVSDLANLRYPISKISIIMRIPIREFCRQVSVPGNPVEQAYQRGKLSSEIKYRQSVKEQAEKGIQWAVEMVQLWDIEQKKEELGLHQNMI